MQYSKSVLKALNKNVPRSLTHSALHFPPPLLNRNGFSIAQDFSTVSPPILLPSLLLHASSPYPSPLSVPQRWEKQSGFIKCSSVCLKLCYKKQHSIIKKTDPAALFIFPPLPLSKQLVFNVVSCSFLCSLLCVRKTTAKWLST